MLETGKNSQKLTEATALFNAGKHEESYQAFNAYLLTAAGDSSVWSMQCKNLRKLRKLEASEACAARAVELALDNARLLSDLGHAYTLTGKKEAAYRAHEKAISFNPNNVGVVGTYAICLRTFGEFDKAKAYFDRAFELDPKNTLLRWERATTYLQLGLLKDGWEDFELRRELGIVTPRNYPMPAWSGEDLSGKSILLCEEQGFGDTMLCSRYAPLVAARGARVFLYCHKSLHRLFGKIPGIEKIVWDGDALKETPDFYCNLMSLPRIFGTSLESIPAPTTFFIPPAPPQAVTDKLNLSGNNLKIGVVWSGNEEFSGNHKRAVSIEKFLPLAGIPGIQLYSLQKGAREKDISDIGADSLIIGLGSHLNDFADTAATLKKLDLVIMTDSSVAHLAGSIGTPVWNLLHMSPFWLYMTGQEDTPWYGSMRLIRQKTAGDWDDVFDRVKNDLFQIAASRAASRVA